MSFEFRKGKYLSRIWYGERPGDPMNVTFTLWRDLPDGCWNLEVRYRYYSDKRVFDSEDKRSEYGFSIEQGPTEAEVIQNHI